MTFAVRAKLYNHVAIPNPSFMKPPSRILRTKTPHHNQLKSPIPLSSSLAVQLGQREDTGIGGEYIFGSPSG